MSKRHFDHVPSAYVCWSRMQAEAGENLEQILRRKELERLAGRGLFLWGVGNAPASGIRALARAGKQVPVVFSLMKTKAKTCDASPDRITIWRQYLDKNGVEQPLPRHVLVTSRRNSKNGTKKNHYALMCKSDVSLRLAHDHKFDHRAYRNASVTGAPVGNSQVTALLEATGTPSGTAEYEANLTAWLVESYWVRLTAPLELSQCKIAALARATEITTDRWHDFVSDLREGDLQCHHLEHAQLKLF